MTATAAAHRPDLERALAHLASGAPREGDLDPIGSLRKFVRQYGDVGPRQPLAGVSVSAAASAPFAAEWIVAPEGDETRRLVYLHGGGWVAGDLDSHRALAAGAGGRTGWAVLLVDYRLAPEHPFPDSYHDCLAALRWVRANGPGGAGVATAVVAAGDSAGANLAAAASLAAGSDRPDRLRPDLRAA